jgi:DNA repair protein RadC
MVTLKVIKKGYSSEKEQMTDPVAVCNAMKFLEDEDREKLYVLHLDSKRRILGKELISVGTLKTSLIHPREVFKGAIVNNSDSIIFVHNHPSGDATPSREDIGITERLIASGELLGIDVVDHIIVGCNIYTSMKTECKSTAALWINEKQKKYTGKKKKG